MPAIDKPSLNDLAAFAAVATHRSFRLAAQELGTAPSTLSHAVRGLEDRLGVRLLNRSTRSVSPTEAGLQFLGKVRQAMSALDEALDSVGTFRGTVAGTVRINAPRLAAAIIAREVLPAMTARHADVTVDLVVEGGLVDIVATGFDAGVRLEPWIPRDMVAQTLGPPIRRICVASPDYLKQSGPLKTPSDLMKHRCIGHRLPGGRLYRWEFREAKREHFQDMRYAFILNDQELMVAAAIDGLGVAYVASPAAQAAIDDGHLREVLTVWMPPPQRLGIYYPGQRTMPAALRAFLEVVCETTA